MGLAYFVNLIYHPRVLARIPLRTVVYNIPMTNKWRDARTGRFVAPTTAHRRLGATSYWNRVRAVVRAGETRTFAESRKLLTGFDEQYDLMSDEEREQVREDMFGKYNGR